MAKYNRSNFMELENVDGVKERDLLLTNWDLFKIKRPMTFATMARSFIARPDLFSLKFYGVTDYWWIVAKINNIQDWWNDVAVGDIVNVPSLGDIEDWYLNVQSKQ